MSDSVDTPETTPPETGADAARSSDGKGRRGKRIVVIAGATLFVVIGAVGALLFVESQASIDPGATALADVQLPPGATLIAISATDTHRQPVALIQSGSSVIPAHPTPPGTVITVRATVHNGLPARWILGSTSQIIATITTPVARISSPVVQTVPAGSPVAVSFSQPIARAAITPADAAVTTVHSAIGLRVVAIPHAGANGTAQVAAAARAWETLPAPVQVAWFAPNVKTQVLASPSASSPMTPFTPILLTYSKPIAGIPGALHARISPPSPGAWRAVDSRTVAFTPAGAGFAPDSVIHLTLPAGTEVAGAPTRVVNWTIAKPSPIRAEQLLAQLGYLPLRFTPTVPVARTQQAQVVAIFAPPSGRFTWRSRSVPTALRTTWATNSAVMMQGAVMAFEDQHQLTADGVIGPKIWEALVQAVLAGQNNSFGYSFVNVTRTQPETLTLWHNGHVILTAAVNTGIPGASTQPGVFPVYLRERTGTMSGTNPDGTKYHDPGIPWISYFNGGDALHGFIRGSYGSPQSLGCVEMPFATAGAVWPFTPIGTLVDVQQ